jgi:hypothetical protein
LEVKLFEIEAGFSPEYAATLQQAAAASLCATTDSASQERTKKIVTKGLRILFC